ncbi:MAG: hypothetical protein AAFY98_02515 [Verrucomicrobiota bacterium]
MRLISFSLLSFLVFSLSSGFGQESIKAIDCDGIERTLNEQGLITVIIYSNAALQEWTRKAGTSVDPFHGNPLFRQMVVVDLRGTLASLAKGYTQRRMSRDLNTEAQRLIPYYREKGNPNDPREDLVAIADFDGELSKQLGWERASKEKRVLLFGRDGKVLKRWKSIEDLNELVTTVQAQLEASSSP